MKCALLKSVTVAMLCVAGATTSQGQVQVPVPQHLRGTLSAERSGFHDAANIRTVFWNYGMVGDYPRNPGNVDLSVFHSAEVPKGTGMNYSDGITPFVLTKFRQRGHVEDSYIMETGFRERQATSPYHERDMRFEPRPGYFQESVSINPARSPAISSDRRTWPNSWPDKDNSWNGSWNGYFGKRAAADQESFVVLDDDYYDAWDYYPDSRDSTRRGLGLRIEVRGFQWANPQAGNVIFWHYDITNESTTDYPEVVFGLYMDAGVGGSALSCDGIFESDDDNAFFNRTFDEDILNLVYTWDRTGRGIDLNGNCSRTGYLGYAYLETPGNAFDDIDNDSDGIRNERRDAGPGEQIIGQDAIRAWVTREYDLARFEAEYGPLENRIPYRIGSWWTGDEDMDWNPDVHDLGADGIPESGDLGEGDGIPTLGEASFDRTDLNESDQIGLTGFKLNRISAGVGGNPDEVDNIVFFTNNDNWPQRLFEQFTDPDPAVRFGPGEALNYNLGFLFASGPFGLRAGQTERFSLALAYAGDLNELRRTVRTVQQIYDANYQFAVPPKLPTLTAEAGDGYVRLSWDDVAERGADPVTGEFDFEGYRIYRSSDPNFLDPRVISTGTGSGPIGNGRPIKQFDLDNGRNGFSDITVEGVAYYLGDDSGITHTWSDTTVVNGMQYYYAVCAYDFGSEAFEFYPSENAITVSQTPRGGTILPSNTVAVRPEPRVTGFVGANPGEAQHSAGDGVGAVVMRVVNSALVPDRHRLAVRFIAHSDSVHAQTYALVDTTPGAASGTVYFENGRDFAGEGIGPIGAGLLPVVTTPRMVTVDTTRSGFGSSPTNARLLAEYQPVLPINLRRIGFPDDITVVFSNVVVDTGLAIFPLPARPAKFRVIGHAAAGDRTMDFRFRDNDANGTLSRSDESIDIVTYLASAPGTPQITWRLQLDPNRTSDGMPLRIPGLGDSYDLRLVKPFGADDLFVFDTRGEHVDPARALAEPLQPYVVPNPYLASASFEPERFNISGRGERRIEFRALPSRCVIRIFNVRGDLVQRLEHDGSTAGMVPWNLRTKDNLELSPGLYIYHVDGGELGSSTGKFAVLK